MSGHAAAVGFTAGISLITFGLGSYHCLKSSKSFKKTNELKAFSLASITVGVFALAMSAGIVYCQHCKNPAMSLADKFIKASMSTNSFSSDITAKITAPFEEQN